MKTYKLNEQFEEFINYKKYTSCLRPASIKTYEDVWRHFTQQMPEVVTAEDLSPEVITQFFGRLQTRTRLVGKEIRRGGIKNSTIDTYGRRLKCFFDWLIVRRELEENPILLKDLPKPEYSDERALTQSHIEKILVAVSQNSKNVFTKRRDLAMLHILIYSGVRRGELLGIKVTDIDFVKNTLRIDASTSKSKVMRKVPLNKVALQSLDEYMSARRERKIQCEYLWVSDVKDDKFTVHGLKHWVERIREWSGVEFHVHRFRHSFACALANNKVNLIKIQKLLGHSDLRMTQKYLRSLGVEDMRDAMDNLSLNSF